MNKVSPIRTRLRLHFAPFFDLAVSIFILIFVPTIPKGAGLSPTLKVLEGYFPLNLDFPNSQ